MSAEASKEWLKDNPYNVQKKGNQYIITRDYYDPKTRSPSNLRIFVRSGETKSILNVTLTIDDKGMLRIKRKLIYMALGCLFTLIGYTLATLKPNVTTQSEPTVVDEIVCRKLRIVDEFGREVINIGRTPDGGYVTVNHNSGKPSVLLATDEDGGAVAVLKDGNARASLRAAERRGTMIIFNRSGKASIGATVDSTGKGVITTLDKHGNKTGQLP